MRKGRCHFRLLTGHAAEEQVVYLRRRCWLVWMKRWVVLALLVVVPWMLPSPTVSFLYPEPSSSASSFALHCIALPLRSGSHCPRSICCRDPELLLIR